MVTKVVLRSIVTEEKLDKVIPKALLKKKKRENSGSVVGGGGVISLSTASSFVNIKKSETQIFHFLRL